MRSVGPMWDTKNSFDFDAASVGRGLASTAPMRKTLVAMMLFLAVPAHAEERGDFGLGLQVGGPTGVAGKYYMDRLALQFGLGVIESGWDDGTHLYLDVLWHPVVLTRQAAFTLPLYLGVGGRILNDDNDNFMHCHGGDCYDLDDDLHVGARVPFGVLMDFNSVPLDAFLEITPIVDFIHEDDDDVFCHDGHCHYEYDDDRFDLYATIGARYYF
jgi:hypothetical protein